MVQLLFIQASGWPPFIDIKKSDGILTSQAALLGHGSIQS